MTWRDRLALWLLRILAPNGVGAKGSLLALRLDSGWSTIDDPKLVIRVRSVDRDQLIVSFVVDPDAVSDAVDDFRRWAAGQAVPR